MPSLGVNVDHVATVRQQRRGVFPSPLSAALAAEQAGASGIVAHLREDRRHIQDSDIEALAGGLKTKLSLEMAATPEMVEIACRVKPATVCLVPEKRQELTTEGGLDLLKRAKVLEKAIERLTEAGVAVSLFVDPKKEQVKLSKKLGAQIVELHTGVYAEATGARSAELLALRRAAEAALGLGLKLHAGHGLDYENVGPVAAIPGMEELNIGFSIVSRALFVGFERAVRDMVEKINQKAGAGLPNGTVRA